MKYPFKCYNIFAFFLCFFTLSFLWLPGILLIVFNFINVLDLKKSHSSISLKRLPTYFQNSTNYFAICSQVNKIIKILNYSHSHAPKINVLCLCLYTLRRNLSSWILDATSKLFCCQYTWSRPYGVNEFPIDHACVTSHCVEFGWLLNVPELMLKERSWPNLITFNSFCNFFS
jgi:hypothetical protein